MKEIERIRDAYDRRAEQGADDRYSLIDPTNLYLLQQRERALLNLLIRHRLVPLTPARVIDIGCGNGEVLRDFLRYGADPTRLTGVDLLESRIHTARDRSRNMSFVVGNAAQLPYRDKTFDIALQFTLLSSVLDSTMRRHIANEALRVLVPSGTLIVYDFIWNPMNPDVRGVSNKELRALYGDCAIDTERTTLAPPLARRIVRRSRLLAEFAEALPILRSHRLAAIQKTG